jgi:PAS domain S-box-containing protein
MNQFRSTFRAFFVALLATVAMAVVRHLVIIPIFDFRAQVMPSFLAVMLAASVGGLQAGLFATLLNAGLIAFVDEEIGFLLVSASRQFRLLMFVAISGLISWGIEALHASRQRLESRQRDLEREALRREEAERELQQREETLRMAADSGNVGVWDYNPLTGEHKWSDRSKQMFGLPPDAVITAESFLERVHPDDRDRVTHAIQAATAPSSSGSYEVEYRVCWPDGTIRWILARGRAMFTGEAAHRVATRGIGTVLDITERKHAEETLRASESRLRAIMDNTFAVVYLKDSLGRYLMVNKRYEELFNVTQQQIIGRTDADVFPAEIAAKLQANDRHIRDTRQPMEFEEIVPHVDGPHTYVSVKFPVIDPTGQCIAVGGISTDISDRKRAADALAEEQEMLRHTIEVQDQERQLVAYEIHDGLVQYATGALMQLEAVQVQMKAQPIADQIANVVNILRKTVDEGRRIINGIHTTILDDCGVVAAVEQLIEEEDRAHVHVDFYKDAALGRMAPNIELALYHITREALTNVRKHSQSNKVRVELSRRGDLVHLEVCDWGVGFTPPASPKGVHGLRGMTERARIAGGTCTVANAQGKGTQVVVDLPYLCRN